MTFPKNIALLCIFSLAALEAATPIAIVGGGNAGGSNSPSFAAFVAADGTLTELSGSGFPSTIGKIEGVAMTSMGAGIIGGQDSSTGGAYAALVAPSGTLTQLSGIGFPSTSGTINSVAINNSGVGLIGGDDFTGTAPAYAALVAPNGNLTQLTGGSLPSFGQILTVALNNSGAGIIGGNDESGFAPAYAARVAPNGTLTHLSSSDFPSVNGTINSVAINNSGVGLIGGVNSSTGAAYAAFVATNGTLSPALSGTPSNGQLNGVALNDSAAGIIGGQDNNTGAAYAALVAPSGTLTQLSGGGFPSTNGNIQSVAINSSGSGIIGGKDNNSGAAYAALVAQSGTLTQLSGSSSLFDFPSVSGQILSVAINDAGVGIIGGQNSMSSPPIAYAALVAPNGTLTPLSASNFPFLGGIASVAMALTSTSPILQAVTPQSVGATTSSSINSALMASQTLVLHLTSQNSFKESQPTASEASPSTPPAATQPFFFTTRSFADPASAGGDIVLQEYKEAQGKYTLWASPFGDYLHQNKQGRVPAFTNKVAGGLLGFDYHPSNYLVGGGVSYAFNHLHYGQNLGHGNMQQEMAFAYYGYYARDVWFDVTAWGGLYQVHNLRHAPIVGTASAHIHGWIFDPHAEVATPIRFDWLIVEPFAMCDWAMTWQNSFKEKNLAGFALKVGDQFTTLVRSEGGVRLYETVRYNWGKFVIEEKLSYINRAPVWGQSSTVAFVGATSSFPIAIAPSHIENLGGAELRTMFLPWDKAYPYGIIYGAVEIGSSFESFLVSFELGKNF